MNTTFGEKKLSEMGNRDSLGKTGPVGDLQYSSPLWGSSVRTVRLTAIWLTLRLIGDAYVTGISTPVTNGKF